MHCHRKCPNNQAFFPEEDRPHQYCVDRCENITTCGEVVVPEEHLEVMLGFMQIVFLWSLFKKRKA